MQSFETALELERKAKTPVMALRKYNDGSLDDVVVETPKMFRAEMMSDYQLWLCCYFTNEERVTFWVTAEGDKLNFSVTEEPSKWTNWDDLRKSSSA